MLPSEQLELPSKEMLLLDVGGDSAGGNLTLSLLAWIRDHSLRLPNAAVALSPVTDIIADAEGALIALGYKPQEASRMVRAVDAAALEALALLDDYAIALADFEASEHCTGTPK